MKIKKRYVFIALIVIFSIIGLKFCVFNKNTIVKGKPEISFVTKENMSFSYEEDGQVISEKEVSIYANTISEVKEVKFRLWDSVKKGDILLILDENYTSEVRNNLKRAELNLAEKQKVYNAQVKVYEVGGISKFELDSAKLSLDEARLSMDDAKKTYNKLDNKIVSNVSGVITEMNVDENYKIDPTKALFKISDTENLKIIFETPNMKAKNIFEGQAVEVVSDSLEKNKVLKGKISNVSKISTRSREFNDSVTNIEIKLEENDILKPGDVVDIKIFYNELKNVLTVPYLYVEFVGNDAFLYVLNENNEVKREKIVLGATNDKVYEVKSGVKEGDAILNNAKGLYKEGDKIND